MCVCVCEVQHIVIYLMIYYLAKTHAMRSWVCRPYTILEIVRLMLWGVKKMPLILDKNQFTAGYWVRILTSFFSRMNENNQTNWIAKNRRQKNNNKLLMIRQCKQMTGFEYIFTQMRWFYSFWRKQWEFMRSFIISFQLKSTLECSHAKWRISYFSIDS